MATLGLLAFFPGEETTEEPESIKHPVFNVLEVMGHMCLLSQHLLSTCQIHSSVLGAVFILVLTAFPNLTMTQELCNVVGMRM